MPSILSTTARPMRVNITEVRRSVKQQMMLKRVIFNLLLTLMKLSSPKGGMETDLVGEETEEIEMATEEVEVTEVEVEEEDLAKRKSFQTIQVAGLYLRGANP